MKIYAIFYFISNDFDWKFYGAFASLDLAKDLQEHLWRKISKPECEIVRTKIIEFCEGELIEEVAE